MYTYPDWEEDDDGGGGSGSNGRHPARRRSWPPEPSDGVPRHKRVMRSTAALR